MKLFEYLQLTLFLSPSALAVTCPSVNTVNQQINKVRDKDNNINWNIQPQVTITRFKGAFYQERTSRTNASLTCSYNHEDGSYLHLKLPNQIINRLNKSGDNWDNFYNPTLHSCDGNKIANVKDCPFTL